MTDASPADDALEQFEADRRQRRRIGLGIAAAIVAVLGAGWAWWRATGLPAISDEAKREVSEAFDHLDTIPRDLHTELAAAAMVELETGRLPPAMLAAFDEVAKVPPGMASLVMIRPFADDPESLEAWSVACPAGAAALAAVAQTGDIDELFATCELGRWSLIDGTAARQRSAGRLVLAHATWGWLVAHHSETELERRVLRVFVQG